MIFLKTIRNIFAVLLLFVLLCGCQSELAAPSSAPMPEVTASSAPAPTATPEATPKPTPDPIADLLATMSVEEKCGQLLVAGMEGLTAGADAIYAVTEVQAGGVILFRRNIGSAEQVAALNQSLALIAPLPLLLCVDEEGGRVSRMPPDMKALPAMGKLPEDADVFALGKALGQDLQTLGYNVNFAPVLDVFSNPRNTVIGDRAFGSEAAIVTERALRFAEGLTATGILSVGKHFPGHGDTEEDSHTALPVVRKTLDELEALEFTPFRAAVEGGMPAMMVGHVLLTEVDAELPASLSPAVVNGLLRTELGFDGLVFTDDLTMGALKAYSMGERAVLAVEAGCDVLLICHGQKNLKEAHAALVAAVVEGRISENRLDESLVRILSVKLG